MNDTVRTSADRIARLQSRRTPAVNTTPREPMRPRGGVRKVDNRRATR